MGICHCDMHRLDVKILRIDGAANVVTNNDYVLPARVISFGDQDTILIRGPDVGHVFDVLGVPLVTLRVPEDDDMLAAFLLEHRIHKCVREIAPQVVRPDVCKENVRVDGQRQPQAIAFPRDGSEVAAWHPECAQVLAMWCVELHNAYLPITCGTRLLLGLHPCHGHGRAVRVPLEACAPQLRVYEHRLVVRVRTHNLNTSVLKADAECRHLVVRTHATIVPINPSNRHCPLCAVVQAIDWHAVRVDALRVIDMDLAVECAE
mmetsp:Transcript_144742/g.360874  ORF Transcript_144742/g.360874 Transcript_144742/m.360874 type:complete len:262 (-) Transcript_144742:683-1468(-)